MNIPKTEIRIAVGLIAILVGILFGISSDPLLGLILIFSGVIVFATSALRSTGRYGSR